MKTLTVRSLRFAIAGLALFASAGVLAQITVTEPWVRGTVGGMKATGAFMQIASKADTRLVSAASPAAKVVEIHEMAMVDNVMRMRAIAALPVPAGKPVELRPGGYHVMLIDLVKPLEAGATVPIALTFEGKDGKRETVEVKAEVRALTAGAPKGHGSMPHSK
jgi:periplasmic copper chaperone A